MSGGGGWGTKAGLLSLDPDTRAPSSTGSQEDDFAAFQNRFADVDEQTRALGDIAKPGSYVWFLIGKEGLVDEHGKLADRNDKILDTAEWFAEPNLIKPEELDPYKKIRLGCIRSTIDDIPTASPDTMIRRTENESKMQLSKDFSAQSELGLYARFREEVKDSTPSEEGKTVSGSHSWEVTNASRIDVPGATLESWFKEYRLPGRFPSGRPDRKAFHRT